MSTQQDEAKELDIAHFALYYLDANTKMLLRDKRFVINTPSDPQDIKGSKKYKRVYTEIFRTREEFQRYHDTSEPKIVRYYCGSGTTYGYSHPRRL